MNTFDAIYQRRFDQYPYLEKKIATELVKRQEALEEHQNSLKEMGLIDDEYLKNPVVWICKRLSQIFNLS
ncbi:hypothetical protein [Crocosphaera watsonii]|uniref:Potassium efflux system KefA protein / Small-conductance mechanosensitive channel n=1 Tax=Crocosphaera watsonii WH 8502 TaxID=423474 RepID=T2IKJ9_CROWT|nr:hypothetical protein [Crocosphaera watsonii]CCQ53429.1 Potassium efflux system KefA protein / Small-conductance mechanosensitive channel [Crocosphaera watsonii WH 8502]